MEDKSVSQTARDLQVPTSRVYNALGAIGHESSRIGPEAAKDVIVELQQGAVSFAALAAILGPQTTLEELSDMEFERVREKYLKLREKWETGPEHKDPIDDVKLFDY